MAAPTTPEKRDTISVEGYDVTPLNQTIDYVALFKCSNEVSKNSTAEYKLTEVWEAYEPELLEHLEKLIACPSAGDENEVEACQQPVFHAVYKTYQAFLDDVREVSSRDR